MKQYVVLPSVFLLMLFGMAIWMPVAAFVEEGLTEEDLTTDLEAENLPTTDGFGYWWENVRSRVVEAFTFNAERKAELHRARLHRLDRKAEACAEIGDEECLEKIEEHRANVEERAENFIARRAELKEKLEDRFTEWREARSERRDELRDRVAERRDQRQELREERRANRQEARANRRDTVRERRDTRRENVRERRDERRDAVQDRREDRRDNAQERRDTRRDAAQERRDEVRTHREERRTIRNEARIKNDVSVEVDTQ